MLLLFLEEKIKIHFKEKKMSATALVITIKDEHQNGQSHRSRHVPSRLGLCPQPGLKSQHYSPRFPVEMIHLIPPSSYQAKRSHPCRT